MRSPILVYLDSSDYSALSDPRQQTDSIRDIRSELLRLGAERQVKYAFSGANLSEMAPLSSKHANAATCRAELLVELCKRTALISFDRVMKAELERALKFDSDPVDVISECAEWYPEQDDFLSPVAWADLAKEIDDEIKSKGVNRQQRRKMKRQLFKSNRPSPLMNQWLANNSQSHDYTDFLRLYPMRPEDAKTIASYVLGNATKADAERAFLESLRDPSWMMRWFWANSDKLTPVVEWLRGPAKSMTNAMRDMAEAAKKVRKLEFESGGLFRLDELTRSGWKSTQDEILLNVARRSIQYFHKVDAPSVTVSHIDKFCPGVSTMVRSLHNSLWDAVTPTPRSPNESDFVDAIHAMYAPYVDIFRADRYMAPHIRIEAEKRGATVVSRLIDLPEIIHAKIRARAG